jgi:hypothetical protein
MLKYYLFRFVYDALDLRWGKVKFLRKPFIGDAVHQAPIQDFPITLGMDMLND